MNTEIISYWWLNTNPEEWEVRKYKLGHVEHERTHNKEGKKRRVPRYFEQLKPGDLIIGYETSPTKAILALYKVVRRMYVDSKGVEGVDFEIIEFFKNPVSWNSVKYHPILQNSAPVKINNRGSIFQLTSSEFNVIMRVVNSMITNE